MTNRKGRFSKYSILVWKAPWGRKRVYKLDFIKIRFLLSRLPLKKVAQMPMAHGLPSVNHHHAKSQWETYDTCCSNDHRCYNSNRPTPLDMFPRIPWTTVHLRCIKLHRPQVNWQLPEQTAILFSLWARLLFKQIFQDLITLPIFTTLKLSALSNKNINYQGYAASVIMSERVWIIAGTMFTEENRSNQSRYLCDFVHHKSHMDWSRSEDQPLRWEAGDSLQALIQVFQAYTASTD